jgi:predicted kinase
MQKGGSITLLVLLAGFTVTKAIATPSIARQGTGTLRRVSYKMESEEWETVPSKKKKKRSRRRNCRSGHEATSANDTDPSPLFPEFLPIPDTRGPTDLMEQSIILLVGLPGAGKSTFGQLVESCLPWKYSRVNQDELSSRQKCINKTKRILKDGRSPIVDRCNFDPQQRRHFIELAAGTIPIDCVVFDIDPKICLNRCRNRRDHPTLPPSKASFVIKSVGEEWKLPTPREGLRSITYIKNNQDFRDVLSQLIPRFPVSRDKPGKDHYEQATKKEGEVVRNESEAGQKELSSSK